MKDESKISRYLIDMKLSFEEPSKDIWLINDSDSGLEQVAVVLLDNLVIVRTTLMKVPSAKQEDFYKLLLTLNATDVIHGAYGIEKDSVILIDTLEYDTMDFEEFRATLDSFSLSMIQHYPLLSAYRN